MHVASCNYRVHVTIDMHMHVPLAVGISTCVFHMTRDINMHVACACGDMTCMYYVACACRDIDMAEFLADDDEVVKAHKHTTYDLMANICHDGQPGKPLPDHVIWCLVM